MTKNKTAGIEPKVAKIIDLYNLVLNKGSNDNITYGQEFLIYQQTEEIRDPETRELLECLFVPKGRGEIIQVQERISILRSSEWEKPSSLAEAFAALTPNKRKPFINPRVGDCARRIISENSNSSSSEEEHE